jgi:putative CocE/NonD family hydrolase
VKEAGRYLWDLRTPMRDGVELSTDLHLPPEGLAGGPYPLVLIRTPASNAAADVVKRARALSEHGFAVAIQDVRGREDSAGTFTPFRYEGRDGCDTVEWFAAQDWCNGEVAMMGTGYDAWAAWAAARERPPHLKTFVSTSPWDPMPYRSGPVSLPRLAWLHAMSARVWQEAGQVDWQAVLRHLPLRDVQQPLGCALPVWLEWLDAAAPGGDYWAPVSFSPEDFAAIDLPVLHIAGWLDDAQAAALHLYDGMRRHSPVADAQAIVLGPCEDLDDLHLRWFQHVLNADGEAPPSTYFVTGRASWQECAWPPPADSTTYFLHSDRAANTLAGNGTLTTAEPGDEPHDCYRYDPADPVVMTPDFTFFPSPSRQPPDLPRDRRFVERRPDALVYTSPELTEELELTGQPVLHLFAGSDRPDTDWFVHLSDVDVNGASIVLATGQLRARRRDGIDRDAFLRPGEVYEFEIPLAAIAHAVAPGHRLRLSITSSCFPLFDRNLNTGASLGADDEPLVATNVVHHDVARPSRLVLPVVPAQKAAQ